jgi:hypothetical protein
MILMRERKSITRAIGRGGGGKAENLDFFGLIDIPFARLPFQGPKKSRFSGPTLPMALVMNVARIKSITSRAIEATGTLIVISLIELFLLVCLSAINS